MKKLQYPTSAQYKKQYDFLKEIDSLALANGQINLDRAYKNFLEIRQQNLLNQLSTKLINEN